MRRPEFGAGSQPFALVRPSIDVTPKEGEPFAVTSHCVPGWGVPMEVGAEAWMAWYDPPEWALTSVTYQHVVRPVVVHGLEGLEIQTRDWEAEQPSWREGMTHFARLADGRFEWLAVSRFKGGKRILTTFLDEGFDGDWGQMPCRVEDTGRLVSGPDGYSLQALPDEVTDICLGAGTYEVGVGSRRRACLRGIDLGMGEESSVDRASLERQIMAESYYTRDGRLFLFRRYNGRLWHVRPGSANADKAWDERLPDNARLTINGAVFVHWYDCLTDISVPLEG